MKKVKARAGELIYFPEMLPLLKGEGVITFSIRPGGHIIYRKQTKSSISKWGCMFIFT